MKLVFLICLSFSVIRRYFFNAYNRCLKFVRSLTLRHDGSKGVFGTCTKKYYRPPGAVEIFLRECQRIPRTVVLINFERINFEWRLYSA